MRFLLILVFFAIVYSCVPPEEPTDDIISVDLSNESLQNIVNLKDKRNAEALLPFLSSDNSTERYLSTEAFGSFKSDEAIEPLTLLLNNDQNEDIRSLSAYALGQMGSPQLEQKLIDAFGRQDSIIVNNAVREFILEAVGKVGSQQSLDQIAKVSTYTSVDDHLILGQARAIYRFGLRNIISEAGTSRMVEIVLDKVLPVDARIIAANYLLRMTDADLSAHYMNLANSIGTEFNPYIRMCVAPAIARSQETDILSVLIDQLAKEEDYRVKVNIIRSLKVFPYRAYRDQLLSFLSDPNDHVAVTTAQLYRDYADANDVRYLFNLLPIMSNERVKAHIYAGILRAVPYYFASTRKRATDEILQSMDKADDVYTKAMYLDALAYDPLNYELIEQRGLKSGENVLSTAAANALGRIILSDKYDQIYRTTAAKEKVKDDLRQYIIDIFKGKNEGTMAAIAAVIRNESLPFKEDVTIKSSIRDALIQLDLPRQLETKYELERTLAVMEGKSYEQSAYVYNHPIDWTLVNEISDSSRVVIVTNKGQIEVQLYPEHAPGSVANFVQLVNDDFYDNNTIHRVVPNFVVQAGCPRGDGYGGLDYTIRSELGPKYYNEDGYIGMASAGPDTEGTQWFITHSPTPHLDGRYTIFGKVTSGMDVVHQLLIGDKIMDIRILKN